MRIALRDGSLRGFELVRELVQFALAHRQESKLCFQGLRKHVVLSGDDWKVVADLLQDALCCQDAGVGLGEDPQRRMAQDGRQ